MYGLVNQGIKDLVLKQAGEATWLSICQEQSCPTDFISMQNYPDEITYKLVDAASKVLNLEPETVLKLYGKHWIDYTAQEGYGPIMDLFGTDFVSVIRNLNQLHARMGTMMQNLKPPSFEVEELDPKTYIVRYSSSRAGLNPMVFGLIQGLANKFDVSVKISVLAVKDGSTDFKIEMLD